MEIWKDIKGYEEYYQISNLGGIYSKRLKRYMKPQASGENGSGYLQIGLTKDKKRTLLCLHKLLAENFIPNPENKSTVNHIDGNKQNNDLLNLEWCTLSENSKHAYATGLNQALKKGTEHHLNKLTEDDVREIRRLYATGMISQTKLAKQFGVNQTNIGFIVRNEIWKHI